MWSSSDSNCKGIDTNQITIINVCNSLKLCRYYAHTQQRPRRLNSIVGCVYEFAKFEKKQKEITHGEWKNDVAEQGKKHVQEAWRMKDSAPNDGRTSNEAHRECEKPNEARRDWDTGRG